MRKEYKVWTIQDLQDAIQDFRDTFKVDSAIEIAWMDWSCAMTYTMLISVSDGEMTIS